MAVEGQGRAVGRRWEGGETAAERQHRERRTVGERAVEGRWKDNENIERQCKGSAKAVHECKGSAKAAKGHYRSNPSSLRSSRTTCVCGSGIGLGPLTGASGPGSWTCASDSRQQGS